MEQGKKAEQAKARKPITLNYEGLFADLTAISYSGKNKSKEYKKITSIFAKMRKIKEISADDIKTLFQAAVEKLGDDYWKLYLDLFNSNIKLSAPFSKSIVSIIDSQIKSILVNIGLENDFSVSGLKESADKEKYITDFILGIETKYNEKEQNQNKLAKSAPNEEASTERTKQDISYDIITVSYISIIRKIYNCFSASKDRIKWITIVEKTFILHFSSASFIKDKFSPTIIPEFVPTAVLSRNYKTSFQKLLSLFYDADFEVKKQADRIQSLAEALNSKSRLIESSETRIKELEQLLSEKERYSLKLEASISDIELEKNEIQNRLDYEKNLLDQKMKTFKSGFTSKLKKDIDLEIQGIEDLIESLSEEKKVKIQRRVDNIIATLNSTGGKN